ncbi:MAG TPA: EAL domain-containing protein, partial [Acidimicrobiales bacterium]|nr:EAL domain-containing protein [Acidimicrobiales bacterium]
AESASLVSTIVRLARDFGLSTVAEGIETEAQRRRLRDAGCRLAQGFLFAKPVDLRQLRQVMAVQEGSAHVHQIDHEHERVVGGDPRPR